MLGSDSVEKGTSSEIPKEKDPSLRTHPWSDAVPCKKREEYLEWSEYFMAVAFLSAQRSKDPNSQVGACIVNPENKIVGIGYNGMPNGCSDDLLPWARTASNKLDTKYLYVCHAELNAILNKNSADVKGCTIYVALFPCNECAKLIIQSGISKVTYMSDKYRDTPEMKASKLMLDMAGVECSKFTPKNKTITIDFESINMVKVV
ncbi:deoxycytidylate deaminase [Cetorhinus maximus]